MQLARVMLSVRSPESLARFYVERLGMKMLDEGPPVVLSYGGDDAAIELHHASTDDEYMHRRGDRYWKIGITLPNVDIAHAQLRRAGVAVTQPSQFGDIGYMCHLNDPEGFSIELLQHSFQSHRDERDGDMEAVLGGGAGIGQITLRTADLDGALGFYRDRLGMKLLSIQPVRDYGFTLYFLAFTDESPPSADLEAVENREWLWKRPYTTLELQHVDEATSVFDLPGDGEPGFDGLTIAGAGKEMMRLRDEGGGAVHLVR
jgi:catechol 2,3-dioxygenase-like lactoylglutathione lyase family enzyme